MEITKTFLIKKVSIQSQIKIFSIGMWYSEVRWKCKSEIIDFILLLLSVVWWPGCRIFKFRFHMIEILAFYPYQNAFKSFCVEKKNSRCSRVLRYVSQNINLNNILSYSIPSSSIYNCICNFFNNLYFSF